MIALAAGVFAGTDIDDLIILTVLFLGAQTVGVPSVRQIVAGQYAGIALLVLGSLLIAAGLLVVPSRWVFLLGLLPLALGIRGFLRGGDSEDGAGATGLWSVAAVTIANGADNLAVYVPLFRTSGPTGSLLACAVFLVLTGVWLALAAWLGGHKRVVAVVERFGTWLVPAVFCTIGVVILARGL